METKKLIEEIKVFEELDDLEKVVISGLLKVKEYKHEDVIYKEGEPGDILNIVVKGKVRIYKMTVEGDQLCLATLKQGEMFGIMSFLDGSKHDATIVADDETHLIILKKSDFDKLLWSQPIIVGKVLRSLAIHLASIVRNMNSQYMDLMHYMFRKSK